MNRADRLLCLDWTGAAVVGAVTLSLHEWLAVLGGLPPRVVVAIGGANLLYAIVSLSLWIRPTRPPYLVVALVVANLAWSATCIGLMIGYSSALTSLGRLHLGGEAIWVGVLAVLEWRHRAAMARGSDDGPPGSLAGMVPRRGRPGGVG